MKILPGFSLLIADIPKGISLQQKGKSFAVVTDFGSGYEEVIIEEKTQQAGFEKAEALYYEMIEN